MALFGREKTKPFDNLNTILNEIFAAANRLGHYWSRLRTNHIIKNKREFDKIISIIDKYEAIFWEGMKDPDPIAPKVENVISEIEKICEPILKRKQNWFSKIFNRERKV